MDRGPDPDVDDDEFRRVELRQLRTQAGISLRQLGHATDMSPEAIGRFETGKSGMTIARLERLFTVLGYEIDLMKIHTEGDVPIDTSWIKDL